MLTKSDMIEIFCSAESLFLSIFVSSKRETAPPIGLSVFNSAQHYCSACTVPWRLRVLTWRDGLLLPALYRHLYSHKILCTCCGSQTWINVLHLSFQGVCSFFPIGELVQKANRSCFFNVYTVYCTFINIVYSDSWQGSFPETSAVIRNIYNCVLYNHRSGWGWEGLSSIVMEINMMIMEQL